DLGGDDVGADILDGAHAERVLRRDGGNHARAVDAERREGLEVRLDAGAAAAVGAGEGQRDRRHRVRTSSTAARRAQVAAAMSPARKIAEMTATPEAPAWTTSRARPGSMPAMAPTGRSGRAAAICACSAAKPSRPTGASGLFLDSVSNTPPMQA